MKTKLYRKAMKLFYKWIDPLALNVPFWIPVWDDFWFLISRKYMTGFEADALREFNYCSKVLGVKFTETDFKRDYMLRSWQKFLEDHKRHRKRYWDADAMLKRAIAGEGDVER